MKQLKILAKELGVGPIKLNRHLKNIGVLDEDRTPQFGYEDWFELIEKENRSFEQIWISMPVLMVTEKGEKEIRKIVQEQTKEGINQVRVRRGSISKGVKWDIDFDPFE